MSTLRFTRHPDQRVSTIEIDNMDVTDHSVALDINYGIEQELPQATLTLIFYGVEIVNNKEEGHSQ